MEKDELSEALKLGGIATYSTNYLLLHFLVITGYTISPTMLNSIFIRFAKKRKFLNFDDFVFCMASVNLAVSKLDHMIP